MKLNQVKVPDRPESLEELATAVNKVFEEIELAFRNLSIADNFERDIAGTAFPLLKIPIRTNDNRGEPSPIKSPRVIYNSDEENLNIDTGSAWILPDGSLSGSVPATPAVQVTAFSAYHAAGSVTIANTATAIAFDTQEVSSSDFSFTPTSDEITIATTGRYAVFFQGTGNNTGSATRREVQWWLEKDALGAGSWSELGGTRAASYHRTTGNGSDTGSVHKILDLTATDKLRFRAQSTHASDVVTLANGVRVGILKIQ